MNDFILRSLSYIDDRWILEALNENESIQLRLLFQKNRRKQYFYSALCAACVVCILSVSLIWSLRQKNNQKQPLQIAEETSETSEAEAIGAEFQAESSSEIKSSAEVMPPSECNSSEKTKSEPLIYIDRNFNSITYGYADNTLVLTDSAQKERLCSAIEAIALRPASDEELSDYLGLIGSYLLEFDNGISCALTTQYFYYSNAAQPNESRLYCLTNPNDFSVIYNLLEELSNL